jgi:hypothetical protein
VLIWKSRSGDHCANDVSDCLGRVSHATELDEIIRLSARLAVSAVIGAGDILLHSVEREFLGSASAV